MNNSKQNSTVIHAASHLDTDGSIVESGLRLADAVVDALQRGCSIEVDLVGIKGASSSYFNAFLGRLKETRHLGDIGQRIILTFSTGTQKAVFQRSLSAMQMSSQASSSQDQRTG